MQMDHSSASIKISFHGFLNKSKRPSIWKHSVVVIITVDSIGFYETATCRVYLANIHKNTPVVKSYVSKYADFYRSNYGMRFVKNVFLELCL